MSQVFKKGHIIPRWCHVKTDDRKAQHNCTFGCDVEVSILGGAIKMSALSQGVLICVKSKGRGAHRRMKGGSIKYSRTVVQHVHGDFSKVKGQSTTGSALKIQIPNPMSVHS